MTILSIKSSYNKSTGRSFIWLKIEEECLFNLRASTGQYSPDGSVMLSMGYIYDTISNPWRILGGTIVVAYSDLEKLIDEIHFHNL